MRIKGRVRIVQVCAVCGGRRWRVYGQNGQTRYLRCRRCGVKVKVYEVEQPAVAYVEMKAGGE